LFRPFDPQLEVEVEVECLILQDDIAIGHKRNSWLDSIWFKLMHKLLRSSSKHL